VSHFQYKLAAVYILSAAGEQTCTLFEWSQGVWSVWSVSCWAGRCVILHCKGQHS